MTTPTNSTLPVAVDAGHEQAVADDLDQGGADERAEGAALAAQQVGAADHRGGDHAQFIAGAQRIDRRALPSHDHDRRDRGRQRADDVGLQLDAVDRHAGQPRRLLVAADGKEVAAPGGELKHEPEGDREDQQQPDHVRQAQQFAAADVIEEVAVGPEIVDHLVLGYDDGDRAGGRQHAEGHHEGWQLDIGDEDSVDRTADPAHAQADDHGRATRNARPAASSRKPRRPSP